MLLSLQQKYILEALRKLGCIRQDQLQALVRGKFQRPDFEVSEARMTAMLRQLCSGLGDLHVDSNFVYLARDQPDAARLEAIDIMLELFSVAKLAHVSEPQQLQRERSERIVWTSDSGTPSEGLLLPPKHFFAARQADGSHRFYDSNGP